MSVGTLLHEQELTALSRQELQKLARSHEVKANSKSTVIIKQLLSKFPEGVPSVSTDATSDTPKPKIELQHSSPILPQATDVDVSTGRSSSPLSSPPPSPLSQFPLSQSTPIIHHVPDRTSPSHRIWPPAPRPSNHGEDAPNFELPSDEEEDEESVYSCETDATPHSSPETSPQPPGSPTALKHAVDVMREVSDKDKALSAKMDSLRTLANKLNRQADQLSGVLRRERESRDRLLAFVTYYIPNNNRWGERLFNGRVLTKEQAAAVKEEYLRNGGRGWKDQGRWEYEEIWGGSFRVAKNLLPPERRFADWVEIAGEEDEQEYMRLYERDQEEKAEKERTLRQQQIRDEVYRKRYADHDGDEEERYRPRRRLAAVEGLATESLVGLGPKDKGKGRMSAAQVEALGDEPDFSFGLLDADDSHEAEERRTRELMDRHLAARLAADEDSDLEEPLKDGEVIIRESGESGENGDSTAAIDVVFGATVQIASDILAGSSCDDTMRGVLEEGLRRLNVLDVRVAASLNTRELAELAARELKDLSQGNDRWKAIIGARLQDA
ncbi:hypothetical protein V5O48_011010 [Marasmius crinis-equi]|uniref:SAP domain-containing protein n=1 Tax=Marasmius crinis-equi TaxID=585013 RepID=A0ABR3F6R9_9AGAR